MQVGSQIYVIAGVAPSAAFSAQASTFSAAIDSFRSLSQAEADRINPSRVAFHVVRAGETWDALAGERAASGVTAASLAIMNGQDGKTPLRAGARIRVVVVG